MNKIFLKIFRDEPIKFLYMFFYKNNILFII